MRLDTELFQAVIEVQQAVAAAGLDSRTVMRVIAERSLAPHRRHRRGDRVHRGRGAGSPGPHRHRGAAPPARPTASPASASAPASCSAPTTCSRIPASGTTPIGPSASVRSSPRRSRDEQRTLGVLKVVSTQPARVQRPRRQGAPPPRRAHGRGAGPRRGVREPAAPAGGSDPRPAGERAAVQAAGGRGAGGHLAGGRPRGHHLRQPAHGRAARLPERRDAGPAGVRLHRGGLPRQRPAHAGAAFGRGRGEPRPPLPSPRRRRAVGTGLGQLRSWAATASSARWAWSPTSPSGSRPRSGSAARRSGSACCTTWIRRSSPRARRPRSVAPRWAGSAGWCPASAASIVLFDFTGGQALPVAGFTGGQRALRRADSARHASRPARCSVAAPSATSRTSARWNRRRRSSGSSARTGSAAC